MPACQKCLHLQDPLEAEDSQMSIGPSIEWRGEDRKRPLGGGGDRSQGLEWKRDPRMWPGSDYTVWMKYFILLLYSFKPLLFCFCFSRYGILTESKPASTQRRERSIRGKLFTTNLKILIPTPVDEFSYFQWIAQLPQSLKNIQIWQIIYLWNTIFKLSL